MNDLVQNLNIANTVGLKGRSEYILTKFIKMESLPLGNHLKGRYSTTIISDLLFS